MQQLHDSTLYCMYALRRAHNIDATATQADARIDSESIYSYVFTLGHTQLFNFFLHSVSSYCEPTFTVLHSFMLY